MVPGDGCQTQGMDRRRERLREARLYLVCDVRDDPFLEAALRGGVDIVQLRAKATPDAEILAAGRRYAARCAGHGALFILNDRPDLVAAAGADGVHVGQDDASVAAARELVGTERLVGLSTHTPAQIAAAGELAVDYVGVGPVHATPTKPGRAAVGMAQPFRPDLAAAVARGGIDSGNGAEGGAAGAGRIAVVRALTEAADPESAARALRAAFDAEVPVARA